jgi:hypothetical protein
MRRHAVAALIGLVLCLSLVWSIDYKEDHGFYRGPFPGIRLVSDQSEELWDAKYRSTNPNSDSLFQQGFRLIYLQWLISRALPYGFLGLIIGLFTLFVWERRKTLRKSTVL